MGKLKNMMGPLLFLIAVAIAKPTSYVKPLYKHHQLSQKLSPTRWMARSDERRAKRGQPKWTRPVSSHSQTLKQEKSSPSLPTGGDLWPVAIYWSFLDVGSPSQQFPVAIDSGSFTLDIPLKGCNGCTSKAPNNFFDPQASSSAHEFSCSLFKACTVGSCDHAKKYCAFSNTYETCVPTNPTQPCTISGPFFTDVVSWGGTTPVPITFGAIDYQTSNFEQFQNIDGVCGMAGSAGPQSVIGQLATNNAIPSWLWSICLKAGSVSNGTITVGGINPELHAGDILYTPNVGNQFYEMTLNSITAGSQSVTVAESQVIIDSGTNIVLFPDETYKSIRSIFTGMCSSTQLHGVCDVASDKTLFDGVCYDFTEQQVAMFPNITISVPNIDLVLTPAQYILLNYGVNPTSPTQSCLGIDNTGPGGLQIVGDTLMENYLVVFDQSNTRIGWGPVSDKCGTISA